MWINAVVKFFSRPALQSESSPPWIFSTFAKRFTSISCRKQTRYFSAYSGDPLLANMFGPYSYLTTCFLKAVALQGTHPSRPQNSTIGGLVAMSKLHPGGEEPNNLEWNVYVCVRVWLKIFGIPKSSYVAPCAHQAWQCRQSSLLGWQGQRSMYQTWGINQGYGPGTGEELLLASLSIWSFSFVPVSFSGDQAG